MRNDYLLQGGDYRRVRGGGGGLPGRQRDTHLPAKRDGEGGMDTPAGCKIRSFLSLEKWISSNWSNSARTIPN